MAKACWKQYTLYKGDMIIAEGTVKEIAQQTGLAVNTIKFYARPTYERRCKSNNHKILVPLDVYSIGKADNERKNK
jgi:hypothetical protein